MHWTEIAALAVIIGALIPVAFLLGYLACIAWSVFRYWAEAGRMEIGREYRDEHGVFSRTDQGWTATRQFNGRELQLDARDDYGAPDATFLRRLPGILVDLPKLERMARERVHELTDEYGLDSVLSPVRPEDNHDFALGFSPNDQQEYAISIYVNFKGDQVAGWLGID